MKKANLNDTWRRFQQGDPEAFAEIYEQLKRPVYTICWRILQSREEAEDAAHDVFLRVYGAADKGDIHNVRGWVFQIAHNLAIDMLRRRAKNQPDILAEAEQSTAEPLELRMDLEAAMAKLTPEDLTILTLKINAGLSFAEIAQVVDLSLPAVYRRYRKALDILKTELNGGNL